MTQAALYSLDNGITRTSFLDGELYEVPAFAGRAMISHGWARAADGDEAPPPERYPEPDPKPEPQDPEPEPAVASAPEIETGAVPKNETATYKLKLTKGKRDD
jgi:hypothetical protein